MFQIVFVCTGNTCRSPMAAALLRDKIARAGLTNRMIVTSAGLSPMLGSPSSANALLALRELGLLLSEHRASALTAARVAAADLVLTMTAGHKRIIVQAMPDVAAKVYTLAEYAGAGGDIVDPFGGDLALYRRCASVMKQNMELIWDKLRVLANCP